MKEGILTTLKIEGSADNVQEVKNALYIPEYSINKHFIVKLCKILNSNPLISNKELECISECLSGEIKCLFSFNPDVITYRSTFSIYSQRILWRIIGEIFPKCSFLVEFIK